MAYSGPIDVDRGVMICTLGGVGMDIYMYIDTPGVYFDQHGHAVSRELAKAAGFPVETLEKKRVLQTEMAKMQQAMQAQLQIASTAETYAEEEGYRVIHYPENGMAHIESPAGRLTKEPIALSLAVTTFKVLVKGAREAAQTSAEKVEHAAADPSGATPAAPSPLRTTPDPGPTLGGKPKK